MNDTYQIPGDYFKNTGEQIKKISNAFSVITRLMQDNLIQHENGEGVERFNGYISGGLYDALDILADKLCRLGEDVESLPEDMKKREAGA